MTVNREWAAELLDKTAWAHIKSLEVDKARDYIATWLDTGKTDDAGFPRLNNCLSFLKRVASK